MVQRDYLERLIAQFARFLQQALTLRQEGRLEPAVQVLRAGERELLAPFPFLEQLSAESAVGVAGPLEHDRVRLYAGLVAEEALVYDELGNATSAGLCARRSLELYAALRAAGVRLEAGDEVRVARIRSLTG